MEQPLTKFSLDVVLALLVPDVTQGPLPDRLAPVRWFPTRSRRLLRLLLCLPSEGIVGRRQDGDTAPIVELDEPYQRRDQPCPLQEPDQDSVVFR